MIRIGILIFLIFPSFWVTPVLAKANQREIYWAGISFIGDASRVAGDFPQIHTLLQERNEIEQSTLEAALFERLQRASSTLSLKTVGQGMANLSVSAPLVMTCAFDLELVRIEPFRDLYRISVLISAQLLVIDFETLMVKSAHPVFLRLIDVAESMPSSNRIQSLVIAALSGNEEIQTNVFSILETRLENFDPRHSVGARVRVANVDILREAEAEAGFSESARLHLEHDLAYQLGKFLSENTKIPVLPYSRALNPDEAVITDLGQAIGGRMTTVFANGDIYTLQVPSADYEFHVQIERLIKQEHASNAAATTYIYGLLAKVDLLDTHHDRLLATSRFKYGRSEVVSNRVTVAPDEFQHAETVWAFFDGLARQFKRPDSQWATTHHMDGRRGLREMQKFKSYMDRCR